jgi:homoserine dehydrogenase
MRLILIGFGTVGQGLAELLLEKREVMSRDYGLECQVVGITDKLLGNCHDPAGVDLARALGTVAAGQSLSALPGGGPEWDALTTIARVEADTVVELTYTDIKTAEPATSHVRAALERGRNVVTTNKGPIALHYRELADLAASRGVALRFEGTVMSGTPALNLARETLCPSGLREVRGILNGTTNFILTQMEQGKDYAAALAEAQALGYAEAVPDADVLGYDALAKVTILANVLFGAALLPGDSSCQGITGITPQDIATARAAGQRYKLIGRVWREGDTVQAGVAPQLVAMSHPLAGVSGATNALTFTTDTLGEVTVVGPGAGRRQTGFAVLTDLVNIGGRR